MTIDWSSILVLGLRFILEVLSLKVCEANSLYMPLILRLSCGISMMDSSKILGEFLSGTSWSALMMLPESAS